MTHDEVQKVQVGDRVEMVLYDGMVMVQPETWLRGTVTELTIIKCPARKVLRTNRVTVKTDHDGVKHSVLPSLIRWMNPLDALSEIK